MSQLQQAKDNVKWMSSNVYYCPTCKLKKRHDVGSKIGDDGKVIKVLSCLHCGQERDVEEGKTE